MDLLQYHLHVIYGSYKVINPGEQERLYQESYNVPDFNYEAYLWQIHSVATELHIQHMEESINFCLIHIDDNTVIFHCGACNQAKKHCIDACEAAWTDQHEVLFWQE